MNRRGICANEQPVDEIGILSLKRRRWFPDRMRSVAFVRSARGGRPCRAHPFHTQLTDDASRHARDVPLPSCGVLLSFAHGAFPLRGSCA
jgi:hypothetical protein